MLYEVITLFISSCSAPQKKAQEETKWSIKMADAVMQRYDTLAYYNGRTRAGWSYDVALLGTAIDNLGSIDPKYSAYLKTFIDMLIDDNGHSDLYNMESYT